MRVVYIVHQFYPEFHSGTERVTLGLARMAQRAGHHVQVLGCVLQPSPTWGRASTRIPGARSGVVDGVPVTLLERARLPATADTSFEVDARSRRSIEAWLREQRFDVAHVTHTMRMATAVAAAQRAGLPLVLTLTDFYLPCLRINLSDIDGLPCDGPEQGRRCARHCPTPTWDEGATMARYRQARTLLDAAAVRVAPSAYVARRVEAAFDGIGVKVIPHGIDALALQRAAAAAAPRADGPPCLLFIGSIVPAKGLDLLLRALGALPGLPLRLKVVGAHHGDAVYRATIDALAAADRRVEMIGACSADDVAAHAAGADLLCLPSTVPESFSLVVRECAALGVPCLVSHLGAPADLVRRDGCGRVVAAGDVAAWADALRDAVTQPALRERWRGALRVPFRIEEEAFLYESLYRQAVAGARGG